MSQLPDLASVIAKLEGLVQGRNTSAALANEIEGDLAELFSNRDDETIDDFICDLASYRPGGRAGLCNYEQFKPLAVAALKRLRELNDGKT